MVAYPPAEVNSGFAHRLRETRRRMALTQAELGQAVGVSVRTIQHWENGSIGGPSAKNLRRLSEITGAPVEWLLYGEAA